MAQGRRGSAMPRGRGRQRGKTRGVTRHRSKFETSRIQEPGDAADLAENSSHDKGRAIAIPDEIDESQSQSEDETAKKASYSTLLNSLNSRIDGQRHDRKRRKIHAENVKISHPTSEPIERREDTEAEAQAGASDTPSIDNGSRSDGETSQDEQSNDGSDDEHVVATDPFEKHHVHIEEDTRSSAIATSKEGKPLSNTAIITNDIRKTFTSYTDSMLAPSNIRTAQDLGLKKRLMGNGTKLWKVLANEHRDLAGAILDYKDVVYACRTTKTAALVRDIVSLHAVNHVLKIRDRILKNNAKLSQRPDDALECRDQGFTRPKVLVLLPTKQACVRLVESIIRLSEPDQQENKARFLDTFSQEDDDAWEEKPDDFRDLFGGNHEEDFRLGLKFTRKTIRYFSGFYNSDIVLASPLGLMRTITTGGGRKDKKKEHDADFLSSIEVLIMDHTNALLMQNWQHVEYVFSQLNLLPKESHGCDFSRVRTWYLDGKAKYLRQTIILSNYLTPEINSLVSTYMFNIAGRVKYVPQYRGAMLDLSASLPISISQTFLRFESPSPMTDHDARFKFFSSTILPSLLRDKNNQKGVLLYVPIYLDFVRLRNHFSTSAEATSLSFGNISEYTEVREVTRTRSHFLSGRYSILLYSERAHHHFRYRLKGVKKVVFYGVPENPVFWAEIVGLLGLDPDVTAQHNSVGKGKGLVRALFSRWDVMKLERIVGTERFGRLVSDKGGDVFDFV